MSISKSLFRVGAPLLALAGFSLAATPARGQCVPQEIAKLIASDAAANDDFGISLAVTGDAVVVAPPADVTTGTHDTGKVVWVFNERRNVVLTHRDCEDLP